MKPELFNGHRIACYDNGGKTADRFTVVYLDQPERAPNTFACVGMNAEPFHPQGIGQHSSAMLGKHLGRRIKLADLPADCQKLVARDCQLASPYNKAIDELVAVIKEAVTQGSDPETAIEQALASFEEEVREAVREADLDGINAQYLAEMEQEMRERA